MGTYSHHAFAFWLLLLFLLALMCLWVLRIQLQSRRLRKRLDDVFGSFSSENATGMLVDYLGTVRGVAAAVDRLKSEHEEYAAFMPNVIRHVGLVRFSPFHDTGGDQSFALALLSGKGDGVVITALHSRSDSRLYAKPVDRGTSPYSLTPEEKDAMEQAVHGPAVVAQS